MKFLNAAWLSVMREGKHERSILNNWLAIFRIATSFDSTRRKFDTPLHLFRVFILSSMTLFVFSHLVQSFQTDSTLPKIHDLSYFINYLSVELVLYLCQDEIAKVNKFIVDQTFDNFSFSPRSEAYIRYLRSSRYCGILAIAGSVVITISWSLIPILSYTLDTQKNHMEAPFTWLIISFSSTQFKMFAVHIFLTIMLGATLYIFWYSSLVMALLKVKCMIRLMIRDIETLDQRAESMIRIRMDHVLNQLRGVPACQQCKSNSRQIVLYQVTKECCKREFRSSMSASSLNLCFKQVVQRHQEIIRIVQLLERTFRLSLLFNNQFAIFSIALSISTALKAMRMEMSILVFYLAAVEVIAWLVCTGFLCSFGQILIDESSLLRNALYNYEWTNKSPSVRKTVYLMQTLATRDLKITAGSIYTVDINLFSKILNATYSYINVLQAVNDKF